MNAIRQSTCSKVLRTLTYQSTARTLIFPSFYNSNIEGKWPFLRYYSANILLQTKLSKAGAFAEKKNIGKLSLLLPSHRYQISLSLIRGCRIFILPVHHKLMHHEITLSKHIRNLSTYSDADLLSPSSPRFQFYIAELLREYEEITNRLGTGVSDDIEQQKISRRRKELGPVIQKIRELNEKKNELEDVKMLLEDEDHEMKRLAQLEEQKFLESIDELEEQLLSILKPTSDIDDNDIVVELTAGVGGQEAMLFASDIFEMYQNYAHFRNWTFNVLSYLVSDLGGVRHASISMQGSDVYKIMKYEGGVHRVQRVPKTERSGRVHTSTMTVAVLPQPKEIDLKLDPKDIRIETKKASGAGGQHVNTTDSAVRVVHIPTGLSAESQQDRSQHKNRQIALTMLHARIYQQQLDKQDSQERKMRKQQVGTSGRSEKIRTYNFNQDRVTDHRRSMNVFDVEGFLGGGELLDELISELCYQDEVDNLRNTIEEVYMEKHSS